MSFPLNPSHDQIYTNDMGKIFRFDSGIPAWKCVSTTTEMTQAVYDPANIGEQLVGINAVQTVSNKNLINTTITTSTNTSGELYYRGTGGKIYGTHGTDGQYLKSVNGVPTFVNDTKADKASSPQTGNILTSDASGNIICSAVPLSSLSSPFRIIGSWNFITNSNTFPTNPQPGYIYTITGSQSTTINGVEYNPGDYITYVDSSTGWLLTDNTESGKIKINATDTTFGYIESKLSPQFIVFNNVIYINSITASVISDLNNAISNNETVLANSQKISFDVSYKTKLDNLTISQSINLDTLYSEHVINNNKVGVTQQNLTDISNSKNHSTGDGSDHTAVQANSNHRINMNNPHGVTPEQINAATTSTRLDQFAHCLEDSTSNIATSTYPGLMPKLSNDSTKFINGLGQWVNIDLSPIITVMAQNVGSENALPVYIGAEGEYLQFRKILTSGSVSSEVDISGNLHIYSDVVGITNQQALNITDNTAARHTHTNTATLSAIPSYTTAQNNTYLFKNSSGTLEWVSISLHTHDNKTALDKYPDIEQIDEGKVLTVVNGEIVWMPYDISSLCKTFVLNRSQLDSNGEYIIEHNLHQLNTDIIISDTESGVGYINPDAIIPVDENHTKIVMKSYVTGTTTNNWNVSCSVAGISDSSINTSVYVLASKSTTHSNSTVEESPNIFIFDNCSINKYTSYNSETGIFTSPKNMLASIVCSLVGHESTTGNIYAGVYINDSLKQKFRFISQVQAVFSGTYNLEQNDTVCIKLYTSSEFGDTIPISVDNTLSISEVK